MPCSVPAMNYGHEVNCRGQCMRGHPVSGAFQPAEGSQFPLISWAGDPSLRLKGGSARDDTKPERFWISNWATTRKLLPPEV
jgi:hypothetical protein